MMSKQEIAHKRQWMIDLREAQGLSIREMARRVKGPPKVKIPCNPLLLERLEAGEWITTPKRARDIAKAYGMSKAQEASITYVRGKRAWGGYNHDGPLNAKRGGQRAW